MKAFVLFLVICLAKTVSFGQKADRNDNYSKIDLKNSNSNRIVIFQAEKIVILDMTKKNDVDKLLIHLRSIPSIYKQLEKISTKIDKGQKFQNDLLLQILHNTSKNGYLSPDQFAKGLETYISENNRLKEENKRLKLQNSDIRLAGLYKEAEKRLSEFDNDGYQMIIEKIKIKRKENIEKEQIEVAELLYLQAQNNFNRFQYSEALAQIDEAIQYKLDNRYLLLKGVVLTSMLRFDDAISFYSKIDTTRLSVESLPKFFNGLGFLYFTTGNHNKAIDLFRNSLNIQLGTLDTFDLDLAETYNFLGLAFQDKGMYDQAIVLFEKASVILESVYGLNNADVARCLSNIGLNYSYKGDFVNALKTYQKSLLILQTVLPSAHTDIGKMYSNLGTAYEDLGESKKSIKYHLLALDNIKGAFTSDNIDVANCYNNLGAAYRLDNQFELALDCHTKAFSIQKRLLPSEHRDISVTYDNFGSTYMRIGNLDKAIEYFYLALTIQKRNLEDNNPDFASTYTSLGLVFTYKENFDEAIKFNNLALKIYENSLGLEHPRIVRLFQNIALTYLRKKEFKSSIFYSSRSLTIKEKTVQEADLEIAYSNYLLASAYFLDGDLHKSFDNFHNTYLVRKRLLGLTHLDTQNVISNLYAIAISLKQIEEAREYLLLLSEYNSLTSEGKISYINRNGVESFLKKDYSTAINYFLLALDFIRATVIAPSDDLYATTLYNLGNSYCSSGDKINAKIYFEQAVKKSQNSSNAELIAAIQNKFKSCQK